jgi:RimJ/RimL family protein N-acetyltransferase/dTDP-4-dehydrorhamnose 3,5-epimerase-like enzyme
VILRKLSNKDAPLMLEWMHDNDIVQHLSADFKNKTLDDCKDFIAKSKKAEKDLHLAITSQTDEYMGTISLKQINRIEHYAEFGITMRKKSMGKGFAWQGMIELINIAFKKIGLKSIYWCVSKNNLRAVKFYDKHRFNRTTNVPIEVSYRYSGVNDLIWYSLFSTDIINDSYVIRNKVSGCDVINIKTVCDKKLGSLSYFESKRDFPFEVKRVYYITNASEGIIRGHHSHKDLKQFIFSPYGMIQLILDDGDTKEEITLSSPSVGVIIDKSVWREILWLKDNSVLCVAASDYYDESDYIRDYDEFIEFIKR